uniref:PPM-type phosphatase domain-containing protein n=1 Tax=Chenopodium quinoa TaxID=63459 RepID=A0A803MBZ6_CHEQI
MVKKAGKRKFERGTRWEIVHIPRHELKYESVGEIWFRRRGCTLFSGRKELKSDSEIPELLESPESDGWYNLYVVHHEGVTKEVDDVGNDVDGSENLEDVASWFNVEELVGSAKNRKVVAESSEMVPPQHKDNPRSENTKSQSTLSTHNQPYSSSHQTHNQTCSSSHQTHNQPCSSSHQTETQKLPTSFSAKKRANPKPRSKKWVAATEHSEQQKVEEGVSFTDSDGSDFEVGDGDCEDGEDEDLEGLAKFDGQIMPSVVRMIERASEEVQKCDVTRADVHEFEVGVNGDPLLPCIGLHSNAKWPRSALPGPLPPPFKKQPGRPKGKKRIKEPGEGEDAYVQRPKKQNTCKKCGRPRHYQKTCKNPPLQVPPNVEAAAVAFPACCNDGGMSCSLFPGCYNHPALLQGQAAVMVVCGIMMFPIYTWQLDFWEAPEAAVKRAYKDKVVGSRGRSTSVTAILINHEKLIVANVGNVRCVDGVLSMTRAFGDGRLKEHISCEPHVRIETVGADAKFIVLASDGIWNVSQSYRNG